MRFGKTAQLSLCFLVSVSSALANRACAQQQTGPDVLAGTDVLDWEGDIALRLVEGADRFLLREIDQSVARRAAYWQRDYSSPAAYSASLEPNRQRLAHILGVRDERHDVAALELLATTAQSALVGENSEVQVFAVRWPVLGRMHGEGLLLMPRQTKPVACVVAVPDAAQTPESICGLVPGVPESSQYARVLAAFGCQVLVPALIDREVQPRNGRAQLTSREYLYRSAFELGRHLIGYELQKILAGIDWLEREAAKEQLPVAVVGWGEGAMLSLYAAALDPRIDGACVSGYFAPRERVWEEPIDRNVFGLLEQFGDAELAGMIAPRTLIVEAAGGPELTLASGQGGAPGRLATPDVQDVQAEFARAQRFVKDLSGGDNLQLIISQQGQGPYMTPDTLQQFLRKIAPSANCGAPPAALTSRIDAAAMTARAQRQVQEIDEHNQGLLHESSYVREEFMKGLDTSSLEAYQRSVTRYRTIFREEVIGDFACPLLPPRVRARKSYEASGWTGYEVVLDVLPDLFAYGILLLPDDLQPGERRPVVVCQHGLEGRPQQVVAGDNPAYHDFAAQLAQRGFITFAPQNLYLFGDRFRTLQRKANPLKKTLFSLMVPQHQQIVNWLASLECVDASRIGFYGLSYGGKSAMRIPALVDGYCLSICSADFNEWVWKNASTRAPYSYVWTGEYEIFEFDLGSTFNYAEMAALIAPRPFMVERGHFDGVAPDEQVGYEFAKVRRLYAAQLGIPDRCAIEWFVGPHTIHGVGTFQFLHQHLNWPQHQEE